MSREKLPEHTERATSACRSAKHESKQYELLDSKVPGLELRVNARGKEWSLRYRLKVGSKWANKRLPLGDFPSVSVSNARAAALQAKTDIARGIDPMGERQKEAEQRAEEIKAREIEEASRVNLSTVFEEWMKSDKPAGRKDQGKSLRRLFERDVLPVIGHIPMKEVASEDILKVTDSILGRKKDRMAQVAISEIKQLFKWAFKRKKIAKNPCLEIEKSEIGARPKGRDRVLDAVEIRKLDQALHASSLNRVTHLIYMLQIPLTCRINELCQAEWTEVNWTKRTWTIPSEKNKSERKIEVTLTRYALSLLKELHSLTGHTRWFYPGKDGKSPVNRKQATNHARDRQLPVGATPVANRTVQTRSLVIGERWRTHDLRRSGATMMQQMGIPKLISNMCLNHADGDQSADPYHQYQYASEMKIAWYRLSEALSVITGDKGPEFLKALQDDEHHELEDQVGFAGLVKQFYVKPVD